LLIGFTIYAGYVVPIDGFAWHDAWQYLAAILGIGTLAMVAFQVADIYQVQAFRGYEKQYFRLASAWSVVFLIAIGATFFAKVGGQQKLGTVDELVEFARRTRIDLVIFALPISAEGRILQMLKKLWVLPVDIRLAAHSNKLRFRPRSYSYIGSLPVLDVLDKP